MVTMSSVLELLNVTYYVHIFFWSSIWSISLVIALILTPYSLLPYFIGLWSVYFLFIYYDRHTATTGGRHPRHRWLLWFLPSTKYVRSYFNMKLVKTADLPPTTNYIFAVHPHTPWAIGGIHTLTNDLESANKLFPNVYRHFVAKPGHFIAPWLREYCYAKGSVSATRESIDYMLSQPPSGGKSKAIMIYVGSGLETYHAQRERTMRLLMKKSFGFVRMGLKHGSDLVPVITFGENDIYTRVTWPPMVMLEKLIYKTTSKFGSGFAFFYGRYGTLVPYRSPITTIVGKPIPVTKWSESEEPSREAIAKLHEIYCDELRKLYDDHKHAHGYGDVPLELI